MTKNLRLHQIDLDDKKYEICPAYNKGILNRKEIRVYLRINSKLREVVTDLDLIARVLDKFEPPIKPLIRKSA